MTNALKEEDKRDPTSALKDKDKHNLASKVEEEGKQPPYSRRRMSAT